ncbi:MAG: hypothetical protein AB7E81_24125 [Hyphomicrobiaceae bacterium]
MNPVARTLAGVVGVGILGCVAHAAVMATGGYGTTSAPMLIALAAGLAVGSGCIGIAWGQKRWILALMLALGLMAGEAYALLMTAERTLAHREAQQAPLREAATERAKAETRIQRAQDAVAAINAESPRVNAALAAKTAADAAVVAKSAERHCLKNCRELLQQQADQANRDLEAARADRQRERNAVSAELTAAREALAAMKAPASPNPLADRLGVPAWTLDLAAAGLASLAANGLGAFLLAFATHRHHPYRPIVISAPAREFEAITTIVEAHPARDALQEADLFARSALQPSAGGFVALVDLREDYLRWCGQRGIEPLPDTQIGGALNDLFFRVGLRLEGQGREGIVRGIERRTGQLIRAA